ncbi:hypothetical protein [Nocardia sp. NPDC058633]|uniref:hypothetical protein n=1 Tax=Nocardia sp. NPDC058633 TaxID=3346568 RepID=UPI00364D5424
MARPPPVPAVVGAEFVAQIRGKRDRVRMVDDHPEISHGIAVGISSPLTQDTP